MLMLLLCHVDVAAMSCDIAVVTLLLCHDVATMACDAIMSCGAMVLLWLLHVMRPCRTGSTGWHSSTSTSSMEYSAMISFHMLL